MSCSVTGKSYPEDGIFIVAGPRLTVVITHYLEGKEVHTRGFIYVKKSRDILRESAEIVSKV